MSESVSPGGQTYTSLLVEALIKQRDNALNLLAQTQAQLALTDAENARLRAAREREVSTPTISPDSTPYPA